MSIFRKLFACLSLSFVFLFAGCASLVRPELSPEEEAILYPAASYIPEVFDWQEISDETGVVPGIWRFDFHNPDIPLIYHAVKIELTGQGTSGESRFTLVTSQWERTSDFAARENCLVAINATPFGKKELAGIYKTGGKVLSRPVARYAALGLRCGKDGELVQAQIFDSQTDGELTVWDAAFGGFFVVLKKGEVRTEFIRRTDSRSGAGLSADGKTLYLLLVEGEHPRQSLGLSYPQCGEIFRAMGCRDALEFDGGGSAELCINGKNILSYKVRRVHGNCFGIKLR